MKVTGISALNDNYIWFIIDKYNNCIIVDPGESQPVLEQIKQYYWKPKAIFLTHHHQDHVGGVKKICKIYPNIIVYGPQETQKSNKSINIVTEGRKLQILGYEFTVLLTPGHTLGHISYYSHPFLFCGDTIFSGGCGRICEGTVQEMYKSLEKIRQLPDETLLYCAHEYTLSNIEFAMGILPQDQELIKYYEQVSKLIAKGAKSVPTRLYQEKKINIFFRIKDIRLNTLFIKYEDEITTFAHLRYLKDHFNS
ncbi:hydroxyacylglutathione hydrolase [Candidatus Ishikawella capsulata]|uniref:Hydroxyacylglutathione hydrolase n=1 Tax=Candidatus Ishikawaella capsulata Mpkobe TaxID=476281 RepID=C5WDG1_9ENTR|nr:hydroxyacylglutathione hydrolase [Candidatus Ishikawaella capsulata]BAH83367.1 predicted hydroxyacylglutathione hydrolase [Candidatus Ishikawaella capsulata Mpkobe]